MNWIFLLIFIYLVALAISVYAAKEYKYWYGMIGCGVVFVVVVYFFFSRFWAIMMVSGYLGYVIGYKHFRSIKIGLLLATLFLAITATPMILLKFYIKHGESNETAWIVEKKVDNMYTIL